MYDLPSVGSKICFGYQGHGRWAKGPYAKLAKNVYGPLQAVQIVYHV